MSPALLVAVPDVLLPASGSSQVGWDPVAAASAYSALAGVVAVGALTAITLILTLGVDRRVGTRALPPLLISFPALLVASLLFAQLAGEQTAQRRFPEAVFAGVVLTSASVLLFVGIAWLLEECLRDDSLVGYTRIIVHFVVFIGALFIFLTLAGTRWDLTGRDWRQSHEWLLWLAGLGVPISLTFLRLPGIERLRAALTAPDHPPKFLAYATLSVVVGSVLGFALTSDKPGAAFPAGLGYLVSATLGLLFGLFELSLSSARKAAGLPAAPR
ncbi:MAG: hypothetical protein NVSMB32_14140 [Actinomycetota bacterium]